MLHAIAMVSLALAVVACFYPLLNSEFLIWDEQDLLVQNKRYQGLSTASLGWAFRTFYYGHYQPLTWLSFTLDFELWGASAAGFRWTSIAIHALNAVLVYRLLRRFLQKRPEPTARVGALIGAFFFALHPLRVEPVAWLASRNDLLSTCFTLLAATLYLDLANKSGSARWWRYLLSIGLFAMALLSKAFVMTLPVVLLILDVYPLRRMGPGAVRPRAASVLLEKLPYLALAFVFAAVALVAKREAGGLGELAEHGLPQRMAQASYGLGFYLWKTALPMGLSPLYRLGEAIDPAAPRYVLSMLALLAVLAGLFVVRRRAPWLVAAWLAYAVMLSPVLGLTQAGAQLVADRYAYLACIPWAVLVAAGVSAFVAGAGSWRWTPRARNGLVGLMLMLVVALGVASNRQCRFWQGSIRLWTRVLAIEPDNLHAAQNRGRAHHLAGNYEAALMDYDRALALDPTLATAYRARGILKRERGDSAGALEDLSRALALEPHSPQLWLDRGLTRRKLDDLAGAIEDLNRAIELRPFFVRALQARGVTRRSMGDNERALADFNRVLELDPRSFGVLALRGELYEDLGRLREAAADYSAALQLAPDHWKRRDEIRHALRRLSRGSGMEN